MEIGLSMGANTGDRQANLRAAREHILKYPGINPSAQSPIYETEPVDVPAAHGDAWFLNAVLIIKAAVSVPQLLKLFHFFEQQIGREPDPEPNTPRPIDIDIIYADNLVINERHLTVPHPRWAERRFVLQPLADVRPDLCLPGQSDTVSKILARLKTPGQVKLFARTW